MRTVREGYCCAAALPAMQHDAAIKANPKIRNEARNMLFSPRVTSPDPR
jgi:hypothetical protein